MQKIFEVWQNMEAATMGSHEREEELCPVLAVSQ